MKELIKKYNIRTQKEGIILIGDFFYIENVKHENIKYVIYHVTPYFIIVGSDKILFKKCIDSSNYNSIPFKDTELSKYLNEDYYLSLPDYIRDNIISTKDDLRVTIPTLYEVFGDKYNYGKKRFNWGECKSQFDYFKSTKNKTKDFIEDNDTWWHWLRTPYASNTTDFCGASYNGGAIYTRVSAADGGVSPVFALS
jgi:hypothetical protein